MRLEEERKIGQNNEEIREVDIRFRQKDAKLYYKREDINKEIKTRSHMESGEIRKEGTAMKKKH